MAQDGEFGDSIKRPLTARHLKSHFKALDGSFRGMGATFRALTFEQGRITAEFDNYPPEAKKLLKEAVMLLSDAGSKVQRAALVLRSKARGVDEETK